MMKLMIIIKCRFLPLNMSGFFYVELEGGGSMINSLRNQPSFFAPGLSGVFALGPGAKKDGCFRRLHDLGC